MAAAAFHGRACWPRVVRSKTPCSRPVRSQARLVFMKGVVNDESDATSSSVDNLYTPIFKAMQATSETRQQLERQLFGGATGPEAIRVTPHMVRSARSIREVLDLLKAAQRAECIDNSLLNAALIIAPKLLRKQPKASDIDKAELTACIQEHLLPVLDDLDAATLVHAAVGLAQLGHGEAFVFQEIARHTVQHMQTGGMSAQGLSNLAWALATAGVRPCGSWLTEFWMELEDQMAHLTAQDIADIFWSICRLELMPPWVSGSSGMLSAALERLGSSQTGQDPATVLVCLAIWSRSFSYRLPEEQLQKLLLDIQPHLTQYLPQDLVSVVHSLVVMNANPSRAWMTDFYAALRDRLIFDPTLSYSDFQRLLWALSRIDYVPSQAWLKQFVEVSIVKLQHLRFRALSELVWALACWGYTPTKEWLAEYFRVTHHKLQDYKPCHLANSILALKKLGCKVPTVWLDAALTSFSEQLSEAKAHDLVTFIDGIVDVCDDAGWMSRANTGNRLRALATYAASKFDICDPVMHAKLLVALATAQCFPGAAWLTAQQDSLARSLNSEASGPLDTATAGTLRAAYASWDVPLSPSLAQQLEVKSS